MVSVLGWRCSSVPRNLAVIGEVDKALRAELKTCQPESARFAIAGLRNVVVYECFRVNPNAVRGILDNHLASIKPVVRSRRWWSIRP